MGRRWAMCVTLVLAGCETLDANTIGEVADACGMACATTVTCVVLSPVIIAGAAGCAVGACTRCNEGPDATPADEVARAEAPPPMTTAVRAPSSAGEPSAVEY